MITAYVKPTNFCNVGCTHCYLPEAVRANQSRMSESVLLQTAGLLRDMAAAGRHRDGIMVLWHGGEPLTVPVDWYWRAGELLDGAIGPHLQSLQTSLIPLRDEHIPWIKQRLDGGVGTSLDFSQRMIKGSVDAYHALWMQKVDLAREHGIIVIPGVVPTTRESGREAAIVDWFVARDFPAFNIDRYNQYNTHFPDRPSNAEHAAFLTGLFEAAMNRMETTGRAPLINVVTAGIRGVLFGMPGDRWGTTCQSDFVIVEPDGSLNTCTDKATVEEPYGNAAEGWEAFARHKFRRKWVKMQAIDHKKTHCHTCENNHWCKSGCPITPNGAPDGETECSGYKSYITHIRQAVAAGRRPLMEAYLAQELTVPAAARASAYDAAQPGQAVESAA